MFSEAVAVRWIRCFEGPRHERLHDIWQAIAEFCPEVTIRVFANPRARLSHAECYQRMWQEEQEFDNRYVLFTEHDFLPNLRDPDWYSHGRLGGAVALACYYATRNPRSRRIVTHLDKAGAWYVLLDKGGTPHDLRFAGKPDPCNQLPQQIRGHGGAVLLESGDDCYPTHYGIRYPFGTHLFWARHLHDDPALRISGFGLKDIQHAHDHAVTRWIREQPPQFSELLEQRFGSKILGSFCASIAERPF